MNLKGLGHRQRKIIAYLKDNPHCYIKHVMNASDNWEDIMVSDHGNDYFKVSKKVVESLLKRSILNIYSDWQPSIVVRIIKLKLCLPK